MSSLTQPEVLTEVHAVTVFNYSHDTEIRGVFLSHAEAQKFRDRLDAEDRHYYSSMVWKHKLEDVPSGVLMLSAAQVRELRQLLIEIRDGYNHRGGDPAQEWIDFLEPR